ncbi:MAG TPA: lamin tail domain-containing protein [Methylomirabilota bacterium]|nr:lamin tail domain-containing protein [Methylomirabilota bacterium]
MKILFTSRNHIGRVLTLSLLIMAHAFVAPGAGLIDVWRADTLNLNDGDTVGTWTSTNSRTANSAVGAPIFKRSVTPAGGPAVRFNRNRMSVGNSPVGGRTAFSIVCLFKPDAVGASDAGANWYGKSGILDAEQGGVTADWGTVITETGNVGLGIGGGDTSLYSTGASLVDGGYHVAVFAWGGGLQTVYVDSRAPVSVGSPMAARNSAGFSFGGINTDEGAGNRRFVGDLVEVRFYDAALTSVEASNVIDELRITHILGNLPRIFSFTASTNQIFLGQSATLSWAVSNAASVVIDNGIGSVSSSNSVMIAPTVTTTYTLTATNTNGLRTAMFTVAVDPGIPTAFNFSTNTAYNTPIAITLRGFDPLGSNLTYSIVNPPAHGTLSGTPPNVTYLPATNYGGLDAFTFKVNDGMFDSAPATVSLNVIPPALPPAGIILSTTNIPSSAGPGAFIAALQAIDINNLYGDTHTFALVPGFGDNAKFTVSGATLVAGPLFVGGPGATFSIGLRATDSTSLSYTQNFVLVVRDVLRTVVINEFHYNPSFNPARESFIELYNDTDATIDLSQWRLRGGIDYFFPANTFLGPREFFVVAEDPPTMQSRHGVTAFGPWAGGLNNEGEEFTLRDALNEVVDSVDFKSEFPWPVAANGEGPSAQLVNPLLDNDLGGSWRSALPTPGRTNGVFATNAAPQIRQVDHLPSWPKSTNQVTVTCKVTDPDGVASVMLAYQVVTPGNFIPSTLPLTGAQLNALNSTPMTNALNPVFEAAANWTSVAMHDDGLNGDAVAGDSIYTVVLPQQANRVLVRYRITCTDALGASRRAPFEDDPSLNFAYFVYDGVPNYLGFSAASLQTLPVYFLITRDVDMNQCAAWYAPFNNGTDQLPQNVAGARNQGRLHYNWEGAFVYNGKVFDHVTYRLRGANGRYFAGKRSFHIKFNDGALFEAEDNNGKKFSKKWGDLVTGKGQSNRGGEQFALNEVVNYFLWNKVGVPAPNTLYFHFRVIRGASEAGANQYSGDFWGLNWAQENYDAAFLDAHDLPKGNLYKLVDNFVDFADEQRYQGAFAPTNGADFFNIENNLTGLQSTDWLNAHANYTNWYRYFAIARGVRHYDTWPSANKNGTWYFEPRYGASNSFLGRMIQMPYDGTDTWGATWNNGDDVLYNGIFASGATGGDAGANPAMQLEYRNVVREIRALLFQPDQMNSIIDGFAGIARPVALADHARWSNAPAPASYGSITIPTSPGVFSPGVTGGINAYVQDMKNFMFTGGTYAWWVDRNTVAAGGWVQTLDTEGADPAIPPRPTITYVGSNGYPANGLTFQSSAFADPQGAGTFGAMQWRIAEVLPTNIVVTNVAQLRLEWDAAWTSPELTVFANEITFPEFVVQAGKLYRARVRHKDGTGRWSVWSLPVEVTPSPRDTVSILRTNLVFSEIMYNPPGAGAIDGDEFEFLELKNIGPFTLNLSGLFFSQGITFAFADGTMLAPDAVFMIARNPAVLASRYPNLVGNGTYSGRLNNDGETLAISHPIAGEIIALTYGDRAPWPLMADGFGFSMVRDPVTGDFQPSATRLGTPGIDSAERGPGGVAVNEILTSSVLLPGMDMIELFNVAATNVDISGWYISNDASFPQKFRIPTRAPLAPGQFAVFTEDDFNPTPGSGVSFSFSALGGEVYLVSADGAGQLTGYSHGFEFGGAGDAESFGRHINSVGEEQFPAQRTRTFGAMNSGPRVGPVVINEIMYNPEPGGDEFVELMNISPVPVALYAYITNAWRLNGVGFTFPTNVVLDVGERVLVVGIDPALFRAEYGVPMNVRIFGPYSGNLQDSGERLELQRADLLTPDGIPWVTVDEVRYNDKDPWPTPADGNGPTLHRRISANYGNDPNNWAAALASPGTVNLSGGLLSVPRFLTQPQSQTNVAGFNATFNVTFSGEEPMSIRWRLNGTNIFGETNATLLVTNVQSSQAGLYSVVLFNAVGSAVSLNATQTVLSPVAFILNPVNQNVLPGTNVTLSALAIGNGTVRYQWQFEGTNISNATNASYSFSSASLTNHGTYSVMAIDDVSSAVSSDAFIFVLIRPGYVQQPQSMTVLQGQTATFSVIVTGAPPIWYRWIRGGSPYFTSSVPELVLTNNQVSVSIRVAVTNMATGPGGLNSSTVQLTVLPDNDSDGVADFWEALYGMNTNSAGDALLDFDGDGMINRDEYVANTVPTDTLSLLKLTLTATNAGVLQFVAQTNIGYTLQYRTNLNFPNWVALTNIVAQTSQVRTVLVNAPTPPPESIRFYRIVTPLVP